MKSFLLSGLNRWHFWLVRYCMVAGSLDGKDQGNSRRCDHGSPHADWNGSRRNALIETLFGRLAVVLFEVLLATAERETSKGSFTGRAATLDVGHGVANFFGHIRTAGAGGYKLVSIIVFLWPMAMASAQCTQ
jgi:hypothetical protein